MISYLNHIREENKDKGMINIILDNAGYNRSYEVKEAASKLKIKLIYLPPYCPNLNLIERLWKYFKKKVKVVLTKGEQPIGYGIGPFLEIKEICKKGGANTTSIFLIFLTPRPIASARRFASLGVFGFIFQFPMISFFIIRC